MRRKPTGESMRQAFDAYDLDGSGGIDDDELRQCLSTFYTVELDRDEAKACVALFDTDENGVIDFDEFKIMVRRLDAMDLATVAESWLQEYKDKLKGKKKGWFKRLRSRQKPLPKAQYATIADKDGGDGDDPDIISAVNSDGKAPKKKKTGMFGRVLSRGKKSGNEGGGGSNADGADGDVAGEEKGEEKGGDGAGGRARSKSNLGYQRHQLVGIKVDVLLADQIMGAPNRLGQKWHTGTVTRYRDETGVYEIQWKDGTRGAHDFSPGETGVAARISEHNKDKEASGVAKGTDETAEEVYVSPEHIYNIQCREIFTLINEKLHTET